MSLGAGRVSEVIPLGEHERRFSGRRDAIYRLANAADGEDEILVPLRKDYHADELSRSRDRSGKNALVFDPFWYWGGVGIAAPEEIFDMVVWSKNWNGRKNL
jgi:hypothetical protein